MSQTEREEAAAVSQEEVVDEGGAAAARRSKLFVVASIVMILIGASAWNAWDYLGTEGLSPKKVKEMASLYERECYALTQDVKLCKRHMGLRHRECLKRGVSRLTPRSSPEYHQERYEACMLEHRDEDLAALKR